LEFSAGGVAGAGYIYGGIGGPDAGNGHGVLGEGAGFIGADDGGGAECFDRGELADEGVFAHHLLHA